MKILTHYHWVGTIYIHDIQTRKMVVDIIHKATLDEETILCN
jgi:hypothetical protein